MTDSWHLGTEVSRPDSRLTPDSEADGSLKVPVGEGGDVAGVAALVRLLRGGDEKSRVFCGVAALEPHTAGVRIKH